MNEVASGWSMEVHGGPGSVEVEKRIKTVSIYQGSKTVHVVHGICCRYNL